MTEPHPAPIFDTGPHPEPIHAAVDLLEPQEVSVREAGLAYADDPDLKPEPSPPAEPVHVPASRPAVVPGQQQFVKWWKFALVTVGVWAVAAAIGAGLYYWWFHAMDKTWTDYAVLMYVLVCMVAALVVSMAENRPTLSATAIAVMSAPFASGAAAAALYGMYVFGWIAP